jgi:hypothetical protein
MDPTAPLPIHDRGVTVSALPADAVDALLAVAGPDVPAPLIMVEIRLLGGAIGAPFGPPVAAARAATEAVVATVTPWACGGLLNFLGVDTPERVGRIWDDTARARLLEIRDRVDPTGLFATNLVIG